MTSGSAVLAATINLLQQIDLETADNGGSPAQLHALDQSGSATQQLGDVMDAAADMAQDLAQPALHDAHAIAGDQHEQPSALVQNMGIGTAQGQPPQAEVSGVHQYLMDSIQQSSQVDTAADSSAYAAHDAAASAPEHSDGHGLQCSANELASETADLAASSESADAKAAQLALHAAAQHKQDAQSDSALEEEASSQLASEISAGMSCQAGAVMHLQQSFCAMR